MAGWPAHFEPPAANAAGNPAGKESTLYGARQDPLAEQPLMCAFVLGNSEHKMHVVAPDAGGGFGNSTWPRVVAGRVHGVPAQGIGRAKPERGVNDPQPGRLRARRSMDPTMPRADEFCQFTVEPVKSTPCTHNPPSANGCGELGAIGWPPAVIIAICNALGVRDVAMPATPHAVRQALRSAA
jgi:CO/xanthine dehydrogenase Mo-binding subunit